MKQYIYQDKNGGICFMEKKKRYNWRELAHDCAESGVNVSVWCKANNIPYSTCRNWLKRLKDEGFFPADTGHGLSVWGKVEVKQTIEAVPLTLAPVAATAIRLSYGLWSIEVNQGFDPVLVKQMMRVVEA